MTFTENWRRRSEREDMDSRCKARGFMKGMLGGFHGEAKGCNSSSHRGCKKVKPKPKTAASSSSSCSSCHVSFMVHQEKVMAKQNQRVVHEAMNLHEANFWNSYGVAVDEHIDRKADSYISSVQERFRLEGLIN